MTKYLYLFGTIISFATFAVGWNHFQDNGFDAFNLGFMGLTPVITLTLTTIWLRAENKKEDEDFFLDKE